MLNWFKRRNQSDATLALCPGNSGIGLAAVSRDANQQPVLEWADFVDGARASTRGPTLSAALRKHNFENHHATSLLPLGEYNLLLVEAPDVPKEELRAAVRWRVKDLIDFDIDDAVIDVVEVPPLKGGRDNMLYAVVARRVGVRALIDEIEAADVALDVVDIPEFSLRNLAGLVAEDVGGLAFIYLDDDTGMITITRQNSLYLSRRFDGGRKRLLASGASEVSADLEGLLDSIVIEVQRSLDYYESQFAQPPVQGIVVAPLGREIRGIDTYLGSQLGVPTRMLEFSELMELRQPLSDEAAARCVTAIGAALRLGEVTA